MLQNNRKVRVNLVIYYLFCLGGRLPVLSRDDVKANLKRNSCSHILEIPTYLTLLVNVWVVNQGSEADLGRLKRILCWKDKVDQKSSLENKNYFSNTQPHKITLL